MMYDSEPLKEFLHSAVRLDVPSAYLLRKARKSKQGASDLEKVGTSSTVYVGNLSFYTTEEQIHELFAKCGELKQVIMGLDRFQKTPCGFCFVEYSNHTGALAAVKYLNGTKLDDRELQIDLDPGFVDGRQYGRGASGGQVHDEYRFEFDAYRGGFSRGVSDNQSKPPPHNVGDETSSSISNPNISGDVPPFMPMLTPAQLSMMAEAVNQGYLNGPNNMMMNFANNLTVMPPSTTPLNNVTVNPHITKNNEEHKTEDPPQPPTTDVDADMVIEN